MSVATETSVISAVQKEHFHRLVRGFPPVLVELNLVKASVDVDLVLPGAVHRVDRDLQDRPHVI